MRPPSRGWLPAAKMRHAAISCKLAVPPFGWRLMSCPNSKENSAAHGASKDDSGVLDARSALASPTPPANPPPSGPPSPRRGAPASGSGGGRKRRAHRHRRLGRLPRASAGRPVLRHGVNALLRCERPQRVRKDRQCKDRGMGRVVIDDLVSRLHFRIDTERMAGVGIAVVVREVAA